ncbi:hypothetical protein IEO21_10281 [Rhodonia placenta]|uniref:Uncharacterized protein n=1 Tax=Rhodonia placenta TaxID=104341 RepID=A0A8H7TXG1_9APHY|nr:hypothetical protein IEO21_10281 [Postia placenta]
MVLRWTKRDPAAIRKAVKHESNVKNEESQNTIPIAQPRPRMSRTNFATILDHRWSIDLATQTITVATDDVHMHDDDCDYIELAAELSAVTLDGAIMTPHCDTPDSVGPLTPAPWTSPWGAQCASPESNKHSVTYSAESSTPGSDRPDTPMEWTTLWDASCVSPEFGKESVAHIGSPHEVYVSDTILNPMWPLTHGMLGQRREPMGSGSDSVIKGLARTGCQRRAMMNTTTTTRIEGTDVDGVFEYKTRTTSTQA